MTTAQQPNTERIPLKGHKPLSHTTIHGWPAILFGVIFLIMGSPILAIGMGWMDYPKSSIHAPLWVIGVVGGLFVACGVWLILHGANGLRRLWNMENSNFLIAPGSGTIPGTHKESSTAKLKNP